MIAVSYPIHIHHAKHTYPSQLAKSWYMFYFQLPGLPKLWLRDKGLTELWRAWSPGFTPNPSENCFDKKNQQQTGQLCCEISECIHTKRQFSPYLYFSCEEYFDTVLHTFDCPRILAAAVAYYRWVCPKKKKRKNLRTYNNKEKRFIRAFY